MMEDIQTSCLKPNRVETHYKCTGSSRKFVKYLQTAFHWLMSLKKRKTYKNKEFTARENRLHNLKVRKMKNN